MFSKKDAEIMTYLRRNAREKVTDISKMTKVPATTIYDKLRVHNKKYIKKHTALLDFPKLGLHAKAQVSIKIGKDSRDALQKFLVEHPNVNSLSRVNFGSDFLAEVIFKNFAEVEKFTDILERNFNTEKIQVFNISEDIKKEEFLTKPEHFEVMSNGE